MANNFKEPGDKPNTTQGAVLAIFLGAFFLASLPFCRAKDPDPAALKANLDESSELLAQITASPSFRSQQPAAPNTPGEPQWTKSDPKEFAPLEWKRKVRTVADQRLFNLDDPPMITHWGRYPLYIVAGLPRDLVDGFFGAFSFVPLFNLGLTGVCYEIVPTQRIIRHKNDLHGERGRANANGHGWVDAENGWGFFSHKKQTKFKEVDQVRLKFQREHNAGLERTIATVNARVAEHNTKVNALRTQYFNDTTRHYQAGNYREAIRRLLGYTEVDTANRQAKAMFIVSLVAELPRIEHRQWALALLEKRLPAGSLTLSLIKSELKKLRKKDPFLPEPPLYLAIVNLRLKSYSQALDNAEHLVTLDRGNPLYQQLRLEAALASAHPPWIEAATRSIEITEGADATRARHARGRQAFVMKDYDLAAKIYSELIITKPSRARFHYLLGMAGVSKAVQMGLFADTKSKDALQRATRLARTLAEERLYQKAYRAAELLRVPGR